MKPKKSYGQHFLTVESIAEKIAKSLTLQEQYQQVIEIGPGKGMLTKYLLDQPYQLTAIEADQDMVDYLAKYYPQLSVMSINFLRVDLAEHFNKPFAIIGNFPYNISSQIIFKMLDHRELVPELVGMFQKEMADRVVAKPGNKIYGVISVLTQAYYEGTFLFKVKNTSFFPPPKVESAVIRLTRKPNQELGCDPVLFKKIVKGTFGQRRKMLRNTLKSFVPNTDMLQDPFFQQRPERLSVEDFVTVTNKIQGINS